MLKVLGVQVARDETALLAVKDGPKVLCAGVFPVRRVMSDVLEIDFAGGLFGDQVAGGKVLARVVENTEIWQRPGALSAWVAEIDVHPESGKLFLKGWATA